MSAFIQILLSAYKDPYASNVVLLMRCEGTNGAAVFTDSGPLGLSVTGNGGYVTTTEQVKFGTTSAKLTNSGQFYFAATTASQLTGDFTIEMWAYWTFTPGAWVGLIGDSWAGGDLMFFGRNGAALVFGLSGFVPTITGGTVSNNAWHHCAVTRVGTTITVWLDGSSVGTCTSSNTINPGGRNVTLGAYKDGIYRMTGYLDNIRITKGVARYISAFTPPGSDF